MENNTVTSKGITAYVIGAVGLAASIGGIFYAHKKRLWWMGVNSVCLYYLERHLALPLPQ
jgi:hypothetical protein